jgi:putative transposase
MLEADLALACRFFEVFFEIELTPKRWSQVVWRLGDTP